MEIERQRQEQRRIASERQQQQQRSPQHNLKLLEQWQEAAIALGKSAEYVERILLVTADYQCGLPLSEKAIAARQKNLAANPAKNATSSAGVKADPRPRAGTKETRARSGFGPMRCADFSYLWGEGPLFTGQSGASTCRGLLTTG